jgi:hypothetical protein
MQYRLTVTFDAPVQAFGRASITNQAGSYEVARGAGHRLSWPAFSLLPNNHRRQKTIVCATLAGPAFSLLLNIHRPQEIAC